MRAREHPSMHARASGTTHGETKQLCTEPPRAGSHQGWVKARVALGVRGVGPRRSPEPLAPDPKLLSYGLPTLQWRQRPFAACGRALPHLQGWNERPHLIKRWRRKTGPDRQYHQPPAALRAQRAFTATGVPRHVAAYTTAKAPRPSSSPTWRTRGGQERGSISIQEEVQLAARCAVGSR